MVFADFNKVRPQTHDAAGCGDHGPAAQLDVHVSEAEGFEIIGDAIIFGDDCNVGRKLAYRIDQKLSVDENLITTVIHRREEAGRRGIASRSEEHTSELQSLMRISYAVFCLKKTKKKTRNNIQHEIQKTKQRRTV